MNEKVRVRFAPSPTGHLHIGGARTALFNWLFARGKGGVFILRIEDTDRERSTEESYRAIVEALRWLGLEWDEGPLVGGEFGPYFQSERRQIYREWAERLLTEGKAYRCFCTTEEIRKRKEEMRKQGKPPMYDRKCRDLEENQIQRFLSEGKPFAIRFRMPVEGHISFEDIIHGKLTFERSNLDDFVIVKSDGFPTYNFAAAVDDALMQITHIIRGDDHLSNTPRQVALYEAFGITPPQFAHVPLIMGPDRTRLSKRHGATSIAQFKEDGYLPEAMINYLALLGWSYDDSTQIFTREELIQKFSLERVSRTPAVFDYQKLQWLNGEYMKKKSTDEKIELVIPFLEKAGLIKPPVDDATRDYLRKIIEVIGERLKMPGQIIEYGGFFFRDTVEYDEESADKFLRAHYVAPAFRLLEERLHKLEKFDEEGVEKVVRGLASEMGLKARDLIQPVRVALTGSRVSPGLFETVVLLGKDRVIRRLEEARKRFS